MGDKERGGSYFIVDIIKLFGNLLSSPLFFFFFIWTFALVSKMSLDKGKNKI